MDLGLTIRPMGCIASERIRAIFRLVIGIQGLQLGLWRRSRLAVISCLKLGCFLSKRDVPNSPNNSMRTHIPTVPAQFNSCYVRFPRAGTNSGLAGKRPEAAVQRS
jgi:hypothetical protein